eukprot:1146798-Pelagomonas_calceolata.AAC.1
MSIKLQNKFDGCSMIVKAKLFKRATGSEPGYIYTRITNVQSPEHTPRQVPARPANSSDQQAFMQSVLDPLQESSRNSKKLCKDSLQLMKRHPDNL